MLKKAVFNKTGCCAYQWSDYADTHAYAKCDQIYLYGVQELRTILLINHGQIDIQTHTVIIEHTCGSFNM